MGHLSDILKSEIEWYASGGLNVLTYACLDDLRQHYTVIAIRHPREEVVGFDDQNVGVVVMARVKDDKVIIEVDNTDRPLYKSLLHAGVAREQIILAYTGESIPEPIEDLASEIATPQK
jgi:AmiR/NasT family two-component response regulator